MTGTTVRSQVNYIRPSVAPADPRTPLPLALGESRETSDRWTASVEKAVQNGREYPFTLRDDGIELLSGISLPHSLSYTNSFRCVGRRTLFYAARETFVPLATKLAVERLGLTSCFAWHCIPPYIRTAATPEERKDDVGNHALGNLPHAMVHNDYSFGFLSNLQRMDPAEAPLGVKDPSKASELCRNICSAGRLIVLQFWLSAQPLMTVIENDSLALCHPRSVRPSDLVTRPLSSYDGKPTDANYCILQAKDSEMHEWFHWPRLKTGDECLCWVGYDSEWEEEGRGGFQPSLHSSFRNPDAPPDAAPRESLECRVFLFCDPKLPSRL